MPRHELSQRLLQPQDFDAVHAIYMDERSIPYLTYEPMSRAAFEPVLEHYAHAGTFHVYEANREVVGFINVTRATGRAHHVALLGPIAVKPPLQGTGVAQAMLAMLVAALREVGLRRLELTVEVDNPRAVRFYLRQRFEIEGTLRGAYRRAHESCDIDSYLMSMRLA